MRKGRITKPLIAAAVFAALVAATPAARVAPSASGRVSQGEQKSPTKFRRVRVTARDIARLPRGQNYVVHVGAGTEGRAGGHAGSTPVNGGVVNSRPRGGESGLTKAGAGTLVLAGSNVYEFGPGEPVDFGRVVVQAGPDAAAVPLEAWLRKQRPAAAMRGWPFRRLLIGPAEGVAEVEGWKTKDAAPGTGYKCEDSGPGYDGKKDGFCGCSGVLDCAGMVLAGKCSSELTCGDGECFCEAR